MTKFFVAAYILLLCGAASWLYQPQETGLQKSMKRGSLVYEDFCVTCHLPTGKGVAGAFPPLAQSDFLIKNRKESIYGIKFGQNGTITVNGTSYSGAMPPMGLSDEEVADVMNYILNSWGNTSDKMVTTDEVSAIKK